MRFLRPYSRVYVLIIECKINIFVDAIAVVRILVEFWNIKIF